MVCLSSSVSDWGDHADLFSSARGDVAPATFDVGRIDLKLASSSFGHAGDRSAPLGATLLNFIVQIATSAVLTPIILVPTVDIYKTLGEAVD